MSTVKPLQKDAGPSAANLTAHQWQACKRTPSGIDVADTTESVAGVIELPGHDVGVTTTYHTAGRSKVRVGANVTAGQFGKIGPAPGVAVPADAGDAYFCVFAEDGPSGAIVAVDLDRGLRHAAVTNN